MALRPSPLSSPLRPRVRPLRFLPVVLLLLPVTRPQALAQHPVIDAYVAEGLENNLALKQQEMDLRHARAALAEARRMFMPTLDFSARYSRAGGGRQILIPVGDLMNPVYRTLNQILESQGIPGPFTDIENQTVPFLREREQETKVRLVQPLFQPQIYYGAQIRAHATTSEEAALTAYKRDLVAEIKTAYLNFLKASEVVDLYASTLELVNENVRVNERLLENGKITQDALYRAEAEAKQVEQEEAEAVKNRDLARAYFNFLLNKPFDSPVERIGPESLPLPPPPPARDPQAEAGSLEAAALERREELRQLRAAGQAAEAGVKLQRSGALPGVSFVLDYGLQGEVYELTADSDFWMASVVLGWNLFDGLRRGRRVEQADIARQQLEARRNEVEQQILLQVREAAENLAVAYRSIDTAAQRLRSARQSYRLVARKYEEGMAPQIELLDARTTLTAAELNQVVTRYDLLIRSTELERATGNAAF